MTVKKSKGIILLVFFAFLIYGSIESMRTATLSAVVAENGLSYSLGGTIVTVYFIGYILSNFVMSTLAKKIGSRKILLLSLVLFLVGSVVYILGGLTSLLIGIFITGVAGGAIAVSGNHLVVEADPDNKGRNLNWTSLFHSVGSMLMPLFCSFLFAANISWTTAYLSVLPFVGLAMVCAFFPAFKKSAPTQQVVVDEPVETTTTQRFTPNKGLILLLVMVFLYVFSEVGLITWLVEFLSTQKGMSIEDASRYLSAYFLLVMVGRLVGGVVIDRIGHEKSIVIMSAAAILFIAAGILTNDWSGLLFAISGLFYATIYPTGIAIISTLMPKNTQQAIGLYSACGGIGGAVSGYLMGAVGDLLGISFAMWFIILFLVGVIVSTLLIKRASSTGRRSEKSGDR